MAASKIIDIRMMFESLPSLSRPIVSQSGPPMSPNEPEPACTKALRSYLALFNPGLHPSCSYSGGIAHHTRLFLFALATCSQLPALADLASGVPQRSITLQEIMSKISSPKNSDREESRRRQEWRPMGAPRKNGLNSTENARHGQARPARCGPDERTKTATFGGMRYYGHDRRTCTT